MREYHWWIYCAPSAESGGKPILIYGCPDRGSTGGEDGARSKALEMLSGYNWVLKRFPTRELGAASAMVRGKRLASGEGLGASTQRIGHNKTVNQLRDRLAARRAGRGR